LPAALPVVRAAAPADAGPVAAIFAHYVATSVATFEEVAPTAADWRRLDDLAARNLPFLVAADGDGSVCGFAYASPWRPKPAYRHTVEDAVYLSPGHTGRGIGSALLGGLLAGEQNWHARLGKLRDVVRQEVVARQLDRELPPAPVRIIDLGCGQGTQALRLARRGYDVTGVDTSPGLLARFERDLAAEPAGVRGRVRVEHGPIEDYAERGWVSPFPAVLWPGVPTRTGRWRRCCT